MQLRQTITLTYVLMTFFFALAQLCELHQVEKNTLTLAMFTYITLKEFYFFCSGLDNNNPTWPVEMNEHITAMNCGTTIEA